MDFIFSIFLEVNDLNVYGHSANLNEPQPHLIALQKSDEGKNTDLLRRLNWASHVQKIAKGPTVRLLDGPYGVSIDETVFRFTNSFYFAM